VEAVGGIAFDGIATSTGGPINNLALEYSPTRKDGKRLGLVINNQPIATRIYDWQLIPIAQFADSDSYSCFTLFGDLSDPSQQERILRNGGRVLNYHPSFVNTLMGLRLFQLDSLIINEYSWDLVKNGRDYVLGAGESVPNIELNRRALIAFWRGHPELNGGYQSYVISDNRRQTLFNTTPDELQLQGEPSYYFWRMDRSAFSGPKFSATVAQVRAELQAQVEAVSRDHPDLDSGAWLRNQLIQEAQKYDELIGNYSIIQALRYPQLLGLLSTRDANARAQLLSRQSVASIVEQLVTLRIVGRVQNAEEVRSLSDKISNETVMLRAINPAVWDAGAAVMRYGAFFRYCKENFPSQWAAFMRQINNAPPPRPAVVTPTVMVKVRTVRRPKHYVGS
jgi:hypothetical protein